MTPNRRAVLTLLKFFDLAVVSAAFVAALSAAEPATSWHGWVGLLEMRFSLLNLLVMLGYLGVWHLALHGCGLYRSYRLSGVSRELRDLATAAAVALLPLLVCMPLRRFEFLTATFVLTFATSTFIGLSIERRLLRAVGRWLRLLGRNLRNVVVIGTGDATLELTARLARRNDYGYRVVGVIDCGGGHTSAEPSNALPLVAALVDNGQIDEVFMALPLDTSQALIQRVIALCEEQGITVRLASQMASLYWARALIDEIEGQPIVTVYTGPADSPRLVVKRLIDIVGAVVGLVFFGPLFALCAIAIKLDSAGPVFFFQERVGCNRRRFRVFKFRTMVANAEALQQSLEPLNEASGPVFKISRDPRITRVGRWLRRTSIDELPQLINVLKGEMSLVGPRPLPVRDVERIDVRWHRRRFSVKPGITCLWQIESRAPAFDEWIKLDMEYIDNWSLALDLKILAKTIPAVLSGQGAH
jgi:exopolysaccharide biosynthesis polyprenyl glycosylphosphotransferase